MAMVFCAALGWFLQPARLGSASASARLAPAPLELDGYAFRPGMSRHEARRLWGEPQRIVPDGGVEAWAYGRTRLYFGSEGLLTATGARLSQGDRDLVCVGDAHSELSLGPEWKGGRPTRCFSGTFHTEWVSERPRPVGLRIAHGREVQSIRLAVLEDELASR